MRKLGLALVVTAVVLAPHGAWGQQGVDAFLQPAPKGPPESGVSIGLSVGYAIPLGNSAGTDAFSNAFSGAVPLQLDLGWRFNPYFYLGGFFQYSFAFLSNDISNVCSAGRVSCSGSDMQFGINAIYTILPYAGIMPYVGLGAGWEIASVNVSGNGTGSLTYSGFQFLRISAGADFRMGSAFRMGPFVNFSLGQFSSASSPTENVSISNTALHMWLQFGLKGTVDL
jgi:hypothetical protein